MKSASLRDSAPKNDYPDSQDDNSFNPRTRPANQNFGSTYNGTSPNFIGSGSFWIGITLTAALTAVSIAAMRAPEFVADSAAFSVLGQGFTNLSLIFQPLLLLTLIWLVAFTTHRAKVQNAAILQLIRASNMLFTPADRAISEINNLQDAVTASLRVIERKVSEVSEEGEQLAQKFYTVLNAINETSDGNVNNIKALIAEAEEQRHFLQHANLMITTEANYELERNAGNVKRVLQMLKTEIDTFMARLSKDTALMSDFASISANETEVVKIITEDLRTIVNSSYRVIQSAVEEGQNSFKASLAEIEEQSRANLIKTGEAMLTQMETTANAMNERFNGMGQRLEATLEHSSKAILEAITQRTKVSAMSIEASTLDANEQVIQKVETSIAAMHSRISEALGTATEDMNRRIRELMIQIEGQRAKAVSQISQKMTRLPESMRAAAMEAIDRIQKTADETTAAFNSASARLLVETQSADGASKDMMEQISKIIGDLDSRIQAFEKHMQVGFDTTNSGIRTSSESLRKAINNIQSGYMNALGKSLAELTAITTAEASRSKQAGTDDEPVT